MVAQLRGLSTVLAAADGADMIVANPPPGRLASEAARSPRMLVGGECNAWPNCDRDAYARDAVHQQCLRSGRVACFANAGAYMASARTLLALLPVWERLRTPETVNWRHLRFNDQAALHTLYLQQAAELNGTTSVAVDSANEMHQWGGEEGRVLTDPRDRKLRFSSRLLFAVYFGVHAPAE